MLLDKNLPAILDIGIKRVLVTHAFHQHRCTPVDKALRQKLVKRIGQGVLDRAGPLAPMIGIGEPTGAVGNEGPGADIVRYGLRACRDRHRCGRQRDLAGEPVLRNHAFIAHQMFVKMPTSSA